jgi:hypothetical protein
VQLQTAKDAHEFVTILLPKKQQHLFSAQVVAIGDC